MIGKGLNDVQYGFKKLNWKIMMLSQVLGQALARGDKKIRRY